MRSFDSHASSAVSYTSEDIDRAQAADYVNMKTLLEDHSKAEDIKNKEALELFDLKLRELKEAKSQIKDLKNAGTIIIKKDTN